MEAEGFAIKPKPIWLHFKQHNNGGTIDLDQNHKGGGLRADMKYRIIDGSEKMNLDEVAGLLKMTYWADKRPAEQIRKSMDNSSCYGVYLDDEKKLVGFARVISDYATTYYLCDVIIDTSYQHMGLGTALVSYIESLPEYAGLRGILITRDAHNLYRKFGFEVLNGRAMVKTLNC